MLAIQFRRREEAQTESIRKMLMTLMDRRGKEAVNRYIITADQGYGKEAFMEIICTVGLGSIFVMPNHLVREQPFVGMSFVTPSGEEIVEAEHENRRGQDLDDISDRVGTTVRGPSASASTAGSIIGDLMAQNELHHAFHRRAAFVIDDDPSLGSEAFYASKDRCL